MKLRKVDVSSLLLAVVLMSGLFIAVLKYNFNMISNANACVLAIELILFLIIFIKNNGKIKLNFFIIYFFMYSILEFCFSKYLIMSSYSIAQLMVYCIIPLLSASNKNINSKNVIEMCMFLSILAIPCMDYLFSYQYEGYGQISMGNAYSICTPIVASIIHYFLYYDKNRKKFNILYLFNIFLLIRLVLVGNRGAVLEIIIAVFAIYLSKFNNKSEIRDSDSITKKICFGFFICMSVFIVMNIETFLGLLNNICISTFGEAPSFLNKSISLIRHDNLSNHRSSLYMIAMELISRKPFLGYGIETFSVFTRYPWPHNLFIQFLFEGGIVFSIVPFFIILVSTIRILQSKFENKDNYAMALFLATMIFPRLLISNDIWLVPYLWCFFGYCSTILVNRRNKIEERIS